MRNSRPVKTFYVEEKIRGASFFDEIWILFVYCTGTVPHIILTVLTDSKLQMDIPGHFLRAYKQFLGLKNKNT
jgi:hypothetical protein